MWNLLFGVSLGVRPPLVCSTEARCKAKSNYEDQYLCGPSLEPGLRVMSAGEHLINI